MENQFLSLVDGAGEIITRLHAVVKMHLNGNRMYAQIVKELVIRKQCVRLQKLKQRKNCDQTWMFSKMLQNSETPPPRIAGMSPPTSSVSSNTQPAPDLWKGQLEILGEIIVEKHWNLFFTSAHRPWTLSYLCWKFLENPAWGFGNQKKSSTGPSSTFYILHGLKLIFFVVTQPVEYFCTVIFYVRHLVCNHA